jgi:UDP-N-acetylglucosamine--N-acetylmuramyl-(pentapeptide) pyrophosphoryl-undecaprenol N-acetylglucosamine transferase
MRIIIAGGGTGGHLFPGISIAEAFKIREEGNEILFVGSRSGIEEGLIPKMGYDLRTISVSGVRGKPLMRKLISLWTIPLGIAASLRINKEFRSDLVIGVGGYASGPVVLAAYLMGIKRAIQEQNAIPGSTNRLLGKLSDAIFISFEESKSYFPQGRTILTGNPVRRDLLQGFEDTRNGDEFNLLIFGGSQGAHRINETMVEALGWLEGVRDTLRIIHQTGEDDLEFVSQNYQRKGFHASVKAFIDDMATCYRDAHLVICRSGATTVSELTACRRASILIPYPHAIHDHQTLNAKALIKTGAARMITNSDLTGKLLADTILHLYQHRDEISGMEKQAGNLAQPNAADLIVDWCYKLVSFRGQRCIEKPR